MQHLNIGNIVTHLTEQVLKTYVEEYLPFAPNTHRIKIEPEKFMQLSKEQFHSKGITGLNYASIIGALAKSGLDLEYEPGFVCSLWFTVKDDLGRSFRTMVHNSLMVDLGMTH